MKFTKEQIEYLKTEAKKETRVIRLDEFFDSLLKPERKKIRVEIEYENYNPFPLSVGRISSALNILFDDKRKISITELPEVFTREDMIEFAEYDWDGINTKNNLDTWLSERKSKKKKN